MSDTSTEVERMSDGDLLLQINRFDPYDVEFTRRFRALAAERDALRTALQMQVSASEAILSVVRSRGAAGDEAMIAEQDKFLRRSRSALKEIARAV